MRKKLLSTFMATLMLLTTISTAFAGETGLTAQTDAVAYQHAIQNLEESNLFTQSEKAIIRNMIEQKHARLQSSVKSSNEQYSTNAIVIPGLPDYGVKSFCLLAQYSKHLTSKDIWAKNGYFYMQGLVITGLTGIISAPVAVGQGALTAAGITVPLIVAGQLAPEIQEGSDCYVSKHFKWNNSYNYEYTIRYDYRINFTDTRGRTATLTEGSDFYYGDISEE